MDSSGINRGITLRDVASAPVVWVRSRVGTKAKNRQRSRYAVILQPSSIFAQISLSGLAVIRSELGDWLREIVLLHASEYGFSLS
jgi:hypothetical protein